MSESNPKVLWAHTALTPKLFGLVDATAGLPLLALAFDLSSLTLWIICLLALAIFIVLEVLNISPTIVFRAAKRYLGIFLSGGVRGSNALQTIILARLL